MSNGYGYSGSSSSSSSTRQSSVNSQGQVAPPGFHYIPDGTLMSDAEHARLYGNEDKILRRFNMDFSDLPATSESRRFNIVGDIGAEFRLEIKDKDTGKYYNFVTNTFQTAIAFLEGELNSETYVGNVVFPAVTGADDQYDIYLFAKHGTKHAQYREVKFVDGSTNINRSTGSNSLLMQKVIYQYAALTLTISPFSPNATIAGTLGSDTVTSVARGKAKASESFSITVTAASDKSYKIVRQPTEDDIVSFVSPTVGAVGTLQVLPGENIWSRTARSTNKTVDGAVTSGVNVVMDDNVADFMVVGDRVTGNAALDAKVVTVTAINVGSHVKTFALSEAIAISDGETLDFTERQHYQWYVDNHVNLIKQGMQVTGSAQLESNTTISNYKDSITMFENTADEFEIIKNEVNFSDTSGISPVVSKGLVTTQAGYITFNKQQRYALAGQGLRVGGYGINEAKRLYNYEIELSNLKVELTTITRTTTSAVINSTTVPISSQNGILAGDVVTVTGIGIDPTAASPTVSSRAAATGAGNLTLSAAQTLENGATLTFTGAGQVATITGDIKIIRAGTANQTIRFDIEKLLTIH